MNIHWWLKEAISL